MSSLPHAFRDPDLLELALTHSSLGSSRDNERLEFLGDAALDLLRDPAFDVLVTRTSSWRELPTVMAAIASGSSPGLCHTIDWRDAE